MLWVALAPLAFGGLAPSTADDRFEPMHHADLVGLSDVDFDSGWLPMDSPVQLRLTAHAADSVDIEMLGTATYDWDAETLHVTGDAREGWFALDVGVQLHAEVRFDVAGLTWQSDLLGPWDYAVVAEAVFTPYLLPGHPESPVAIADHTDGVTVASVPIVPDILVASGNLDIDVAADIEAELSGVRVDLLTAGLTPGVIDAFGFAAPLPADAEADPLLVDGVMVCDLRASPTVVLRPHLVMSILGQDFDIVGIDIPIALPPIDDEIVFDPEPMSFEAPPPPPPGPSDDSGGDGGSASGDDGAEGTAGDGFDDGDADGSTGDTDATSGGAAQEGEGCACRASSRGASPTGWWLSLGLLPAIRRRRRGPRRRQG